MANGRGPDPGQGSPDAAANPEASLSPATPLTPERTLALAGAVHRLLAARGATVAVAESLTGGLLGAALTATPGSSATFRGGVTAYASELKTLLLGVDADLLAAEGAVQPQVARAMARGALDRLGATFGLATTGVAGPDPADGQPAGTVHLGLAGPGGDRTVPRHLTGDRARVRELTVVQALELLLAELTERPTYLTERPTYPG